MSDDRTPITPPRPDPWRDHERYRRMRLREDARRPMAVNLAEGIALSEFLCSFAGVLRRGK
jgi:hypothetical protein